MVYTYETPLLLLKYKIKWNALVLLIFVTDIKNDIKSKKKKITSIQVSNEEMLRKKRLCERDKSKRARQNWGYDSRMNSRGSLWHINQCAKGHGSLKIPMKMNTHTRYSVRDRKRKGRREKEKEKREEKQKEQQYIVPSKGWFPCLLPGWYHKTK